MPSSMPISPGNAAALSTGAQVATPTPRRLNRLTHVPTAPTGSLSAGRGTPKSLQIVDIDYRCKALSQFDSFHNLVTPVELDDLTPADLHAVKVKSDSAGSLAAQLSRLAIPGYERYKLTVGEPRLQGKQSYPIFILQQITAITLQHFPTARKDEISAAINQEARDLLKKAKNCNSCTFCLGRTRKS
ncbi:hypothetical protein BOX15_Mlig025727g1 [Macrostomum lignano]|uniref:Uncharacterized protein n=1 Tax=Macrostomum lignano TaxID=282301 RepID=A0A267DG16_9PLAT|nr:hypothetical protein BOX15_Mlig025727g1 [Macrostomum lignano]